MDLLEYQAKELFHQAGIPVLLSQRPISPIANESQATAETLIEPKLKSDQEFYLAVVLDSTTRRPLLLGSQYGGTAIAAKLEYVQQVIVDQEFSAFYARRLALKMGLQGALLQPVSSIIEKMYGLFVQHDLDFVEVNPLAVNAAGAWLALDGKVTVNDAAIDRQSNLAARIAGAQPQAPFCPITSIYASTPSDREGNIGVLCNGAGLLMTTLDLIAAENGKSARSLDLDGVDLDSQDGASCPNDGLARLAQGLDLMIQNKAVKVILVNILSGTLSCCSIAEVIVKKLKQLPASHRNPAIVVRVIGADLRQAQTLLISFGVPVVERLDEAIAQSISYARSRNAWKEQLEGVYP